ncbi:O-methyltransferase [Algoriphagus sp. PAP.12]|uniref:O-methyltransferase n=1 Tax=Algoriphagus sp. PAP.12 TaxID=2996678 RepID=UPI00227D44E2|nr:class I SAM-dependent methyltransferase [Algoriphagus sp. PAP.12]
MGSKSHPFFSYLNHWLLKQDRHSLQSPKVFQLFEGLKAFSEVKKEQDLDIEDIRINFLHDNREIEILDLGAGSKKVPGMHRKISRVTKYSTSSRKFNQLYQYFASLTPTNTILELGTCMGLNARYLSKVCKGKVYTFEGSKELAKVAFEKDLPENITPIIGPIETNLPDFLEEISPIDFALIDANHTYEGTVNYFQNLVKHTHSKSIIAVGDIHWSKGMEKAWKEIKEHTLVKLTLDFYECGIVFFDYPAEKSHFILDY